MAEDRDDRTEPATPRRREEAREKGEVAQSRDLATALVLGTSFALAASSWGARLLGGIMENARASWGGAWVRPSSLGDFHALFYHSALATGRDAAPLFGVLLVAAVLAPFVQIGPLFSTKALAFKGSRIDPIQGFKRFVAPERFFELGKALFKLSVVCGIATAVVMPALGDLFALHGARVESALPLLFGLLGRVIVGSIVALIVLGIADLLWVRYRHETKLKMTRREVRDELKQREGNPEVRARQRSLQRDSSRLRMLNDVAKADVVVRNPTHYAVALRYERADMGAPTVLAKGRNRVAERILAEARRHEVPTVENPPVARLLYRTAKVGREIPEDLYEAVAEILAFVYRVDRGRRTRWAEGA